MSRVLTRRQMLRDGGVALGASALIANRLIADALATAPRCGTLNDIEHVVILIQENRSFDHYFGSYRGVRGFADPTALTLNDGSGLNVFAQPGYPGGFDGDHLYPFHLDSSHNGECTNDIDHSWGPQHTYWHGGKLDGFVTGHLAVDGAAQRAADDGLLHARGPVVLLRARRRVHDLRPLLLLGDRPDRPEPPLHAVSASLDPAGDAGGPILSTSSTRDRAVRHAQLDDDARAAAGARDQLEGVRQRRTATSATTSCRTSSSTRRNPTLAANAFTPHASRGRSRPTCAPGTLPQVSWVLAPLVASEHPPAPEIYGEVVAAHMLNALVSNPAVWSKTALFITYDENGGFFDHVPPPVAPPGTAGRIADRQPAARRRRPASPARSGSGFRVPMLVVSPFSRGGFVCRDMFDHTSTAALPRDAIRRRGAEPVRVAALGHRRPDERVQLRQGRQLRPVAAAAVGRPTPRITMSRAPRARRSTSRPTPRTASRRSRRRSSRPTR